MLPIEKTTLTFAIADDDSTFAYLLGGVLTAKTNYKISFCATDGKGLLDQVVIDTPDIIIVDLYMPFISGIEAISLIKTKYSKIKIIAYSATFQRDVANFLGRFKNVYYCERDVEHLCNIIQCTINCASFDWKTYYEKWSDKGLNLMKKKKQRKKQFDFNVSELNIISLIARGYLNEQIAEELSLTKRTVETYVSRLFEKLGVKNRIGIANYANENGLCKLNCKLGYDERCNKISIFTSASKKGKYRE